MRSRFFAADIASPTTPLTESTSELALSLTPCTKPPIKSLPAAIASDTKDLNAMMASCTPVSTALTTLTNLSVTVETMESQAADKVDLMVSQAPSQSPLMACMTAVMMPSTIFIAVSTTLVIKSHAALMMFVMFDHAPWINGAR